VPVVLELASGLLRTALSVALLPYFLCQLLLLLHILGKTALTRALRITTG
jgi:hypothetical protein